MIGVVHHISVEVSRDPIIAAGSEVAATVSLVTDSSPAADEREHEVADVARRAAMAASARQKLVRDSGSKLAESQVDGDMLDRLGSALERIEAAAPTFTGAMLFRGPEAIPLVSLLPEFGADESRRTLTRAATAVRMQFDLLADSSIGGFVDTIMSTERGAVLVQLLQQDLLVVSLAGSPPDVGPVWRSIAAERAELVWCATRLFG